MCDDSPGASGNLDDCLRNVAGDDRPGPFREGLSPQIPQRRYTPWRASRGAVVGALIFTSAAWLLAASDPPGTDLRRGLTQPAWVATSPVITLFAALPPFSDRAAADDAANQDDVDDNDDDDDSRLPAPAVLAALSLFGISGGPVVPRPPGEAASPLFLTLVRFRC
jgi:hypothetical protein